MNKVALITGVTGQDGSYLAEYLLDLGYIVHGIKRRSSSFNTERIDHLMNESPTHNPNFHVHYGDLTDSSNLIRLVEKIQPDEIYNLGANSHVQVSFELPEYTADVDALGVLRLLEAVRINNLCEKTKFLQCSTSELFGLVQEIPQKETTPFYPRSPYAVAKLYGYWIVRNYREAYNMFAVNSICFNHESPRRTETFVTRKVTRGLTRIKIGLQKELRMGNINSLRDWGHAKDVIRAQHLILQQEKPDDFVISTGIQYSVREFIEKVCKKLDINLTWHGNGMDEVGIDQNGNKIIVMDKRYFRPTEVDTLLGDCSKAKKILGWKPEISFEQLVDEMVESDLKLAKKERGLI